MIWKLTHRLRWLKKSGGQELQQLWKNDQGNYKWEKVPTEASDQRPTHNIRQEIRGCNECPLLKIDEALGYICGYGGGNITELDDQILITPTSCPLINVELTLTLKQNQT